MTTTQLPATVTDITAGHIATALAAAGHDTRVDYLGHGNVEVYVPVDEERRILVHGYYFGHQDNPEAATLDTHDGWPGVILESAGWVSHRKDDVIWFEREAPDVHQLYASLTVAEFLSFTVTAVTELKARQ